MAILGIVFTNIADRHLPELTSHRTLASVPFAGRYRLVDFVLSNMVNSGVSKVGVITKNHYQSLMDHLGSGRDFDLARKSGGLYLLPPFGGAESQQLYKNHLEALKGITGFLEDSTEEYVAFSDSDIVYNISLSDMQAYHVRTGADVTMAYVPMSYDLPSEAENVMAQVDQEGRITDLGVYRGAMGERLVGLNLWLMKRTFLLNIVNDAIAHGHTSFAREVIAPNLGTMKVMGYRYEGYYAFISSLSAYYQAHMGLLHPANQQALLGVPARPIYTRVQDSPPTRYGANACVSNSLIADGCIVEGTVENCVLFRGVRIAPGAVVRDSVILSGGVVGRDAHVTAVIADRDVTIRDTAVLAGSPVYPFFLSANARV